MHSASAACIPRLRQTIVQGYNPIPKGKWEVNWPLLQLCEARSPQDDYELEPGESQELHFDFILDAQVQTVAVYSYFKNIAKREREIGWDAASIYDLESGTLKNS